MSLLLTGHSYAGNEIIAEKSFYEDKTATQTFAEVKGKNFTKLKDILNEGYSSSAFWVRIELDKSKLHDRQQVAIKITPTYLDEIALFEGTNQEPKQIVGDRYPIKNNGVTALSFNFVSTFHEDNPYVWLRLHTTSTNLMSVEVMQLDELTNANATEYLSSGLLVGLLIAFTLLGASYYFADREAVNGAFVVKQSSSVVMVLVYFGYLRLLMGDVLTPATMDYVMSVAIQFYTLTSLLFYWVFFNEFEPKPWVKYVFKLCIGAVLLSMLIICFGYVRVAMGLNMKVIAVVGLMLVLIPIWGIDWKKLKNPIIGKYFVIASQVLSFIVVMYTSMPSLGLLSGSKFSAYAVTLNAVILSFIMLLMIRYRGIKLDKERVMEIAAQASKVEHERAQRERQEQFMAMLTHEIKTPLALIRFAVRTAMGKNSSSSRIDRAVDDINAVIERCQQVDKLEKGWQFSKEKQDVEALVHECVERVAEQGQFIVSPFARCDITTDGALLKVILNNLLENAIKYSAINQPVHVQVVNSTSHGTVCITVINKVGRAGLPDEKQVFNKYYRSELAHAQTGSGLGLYIVKSLTELLGGTATYQFEGEFVFFEICLPL